MAALHAASTDGNGHTPAEIASGMPESLSVSSVMTPSVPSAPTISRVRSYPADDFLARRAVVISSPFASTTLSASTLSFIVP
jgi:hypothetical protein